MKCTNCLTEPSINPQTGKHYSKCDRCRKRQKELDKLKYETKQKFDVIRARESGLCQWSNAICGKRTEINPKTNKHYALCKKHKPRAKELMQEWQQSNRDLTHKYRKTCEQKLKEKFFEMYGRACACCSESNPLFMTLDHVLGDGHRSRSKGKRLSPYYYYREAVKSYKPEIFQTLCFNCNFAKRNKASCPCRGIQYCSDYEDIREG